MAGGRRKWIGNQGGPGWKISWAENGCFKIDQEGDGLTDKAMKDWGAWMDAQIEKKFGSSPPPLTANSMNFSRNELGDDGIRTIVEYLRKREIAAVVVKLFRNGISDIGAWAMGQLLAHSREPVHEVHLSHNRITEQGACSIFEALAQCGRYPFNSDRSGRRDAQGFMPVWLRMEYNCINWANIETRLEQQDVRWCSAEVRDGWGPKDQDAPMVCVHQSYRNQTLEGAPAAGRWSDGAARPENGGSVPEWLHDDGPDGRDDDAVMASMAAAARAHRDSRQEELAREANGVPPVAGEDFEDGPTDDVPMYVFLDASAVDRFMSREDGLLTFQGLLNLCAQGSMTCTPPDERSRPQGYADPEERDRIILAITHDTLEDLSRVSTDWRRLEWLKTAPDSYLSQCYQWGILEVIETTLHTQLVKLNKFQQQEAARLRVPERTLKTFDFACLWQSQIEMPGRVLFLTMDTSLWRMWAGPVLKHVPLGKITTMLADMEGKVNERLIASFRDGPGVTEEQYNLPPEPDTSIGASVNGFLQSVNDAAQQAAEEAVLMGAEKVGVQQAREVGTAAAATQAVGILAKQAGLAAVEKAKSARERWNQPKTPTAASSGA
mmetsp:Transcript_1479/g.3769  ORF Transcript_1479/g.3769 Transcript_1479/m.3769 type:complete len:607 (-) Transcript_1479:239-2059(-)